MAALSRPAYSRAALASWMEQGPARTSRRSSRPLQDVDDLAARVEDGLRGGFGDGPLFFEKHRRQDDLRPLNANVFSGAEHGSLQPGSWQ